MRWSERLLALDSLGVEMHPLTVARLVDRFQQVGLAGAQPQMLATTHAVGLLDARLSLRDQLWFAEAEQLGAGALYSLQKLRGVARYGRYRTRYLARNFGAIHGL